MRNGEGQEKSCPHCSNPNAQSATQPPQMLTPAQLELLDYAFGNVLSELLHKKGPLCAALFKFILIDRFTFPNLRGRYG